MGDTTGSRPQRRDRRHHGQQPMVVRWATPQAAAHGSMMGDTTGSSAQRHDGQQTMVAQWVTVTGTWDRLVCMPVDRGKSWEPAHIFLILPRFVLSRSDLISDVCDCLACLQSWALSIHLASHLVSCLVVCSHCFHPLPLLFVPTALPCDPNVLERSRKCSYYK